MNFIAAGLIVMYKMIIPPYIINGKDIKYAGNCGIILFTRPKLKFTTIEKKQREKLF
jgi:hypothetical protein